MLLYAPEKQGTEQEASKATGLLVANVIGAPGMLTSPIAANGVGASPHFQSKASTGSTDRVTSTNGPAQGAFVRGPRFSIQWCKFSLFNVSSFSCCFVCVIWVGNELPSTGGVCSVLLMVSNASAASTGAFGAAVGSSLALSARALCYRILERWGLRLGAVGLVCSLHPAIEVSVL